MAIKAAVAFATGVIFRERSDATGIVAQETIAASLQGMWNVGERGSSVFVRTMA